MDDNVPWHDSGTQGECAGDGRFIALIIMKDSILLT